MKLNLGKIKRKEVSQVYSGFAYVNLKDGLRNAVFGTERSKWPQSNRTLYP